MPSPGFLIISFAALVLVLLPSAILFRAAWRSGNLARAFPVLSLTAFAGITWIIFTDSEAQDFESRAVMLYLLGGVVLCLNAGLFLGIRLLGAAIAKLTRK